MEFIKSDLAEQRPDLAKALDEAALKDLVDLVEEIAESVVDGYMKDAERRARYVQFVPLIQERAVPAEASARPARDRLRFEGWGSGEGARGSSTGA